MPKIPDTKFPREAGPIKLECGLSRKACVLLSIIILAHSVSQAQCLTDLTDANAYTLTESGQAAGFPASNIFTNSTDATSGWEESKHVTAGNPSWVAVKFTGGPLVVKGYSITSMDDLSGNPYQNAAPSKWNFQAYNGVTWINLDTQTGSTFTAGETRIFTIANTTAYSQYRLYITSTYSSTTTMAVAQVQLFQSVCITGIVFQDGGNRDKVYNSATDVPLSGITLSIVGETVGNVVATTTTNAAGVYTFTNAQVPASGNFSVIVAPPAGKDFVTETTNLLSTTITLPSPEEEPSSGSVLFDYYINQQGSFQAATNRMLFPGGNLDFGLMNATPGSTLSCTGMGSAGTNLITAANNGTFGTLPGTLTTLHPHQRAYTIASSTLFNSLPAANTTYSFSNQQANPGVNNSGTLYNEGDYNVTSYLGTISDLADQPYMPSLMDSYNGDGWRKTYGSNTGDMYDQFLAVNGSGSSGTPFFQQSGIALAGGTAYSFSFFGKQADSYAEVVALGNINNAPVLATVTNSSGTVVASTSITLTAPTTYTQDRPETAWQFGTMSFVAPGSGGPFKVSLTASSSAVAGNDLYLDNITLTPCSAIVALPLQVTAFTATPDASGNVRLDWNIPDPEPGTMVVGYANDGKDFEPIASLSVETGVNGYQYLHMHPNEPLNYYRLKIVNADGDVFYSDIKLVTFNANKGQIGLFPNPAASMVYLSGTDKISFMVVTNVSGQTVLTRTINNEPTLSLNVSTWTPGCYFIKLIGVQGDVSVQSLVIAR